MAGARMSDVSQGPGWWMASDEKWYAPESHPNYRPPSPPPPPAPPTAAMSIASTSTRPRYGLQIVTLLLVLVGVMAAVAGYAVYYHGKDQYEYCQNSRIWQLHPVA